MSPEESISGERGSQRVKGTTPDNSSEVFESSDSKTDQQRDNEARSRKKKKRKIDFTMDESDKNHMTKFR